MQVKITPSALNGKICAPPSKSYAHRTIIAACLANKRCEIENAGNSDDVKATVRCMRALGADIRSDGQKITVESFCKKEKAVLDCGESGSTLRFLLPVASALGVKAKFTGSGKLLSRPSEKLIDSLNGNGADITDFCVNGKLNGGEIVIDGSISSQYVTGLLLSLPLLKEGSKITVTGESSSRPYIDITLDVLKSFGIDIIEKDKTFSIGDGKEYLPQEVIKTEGDYSGAAFMLAAGALGKGVTVTWLNEKSIQGDREILTVLSKFGASVKAEKEGITVKKDKLCGIVYDCKNIPDLVQIIATVAAFCRGKTVLNGVERLIYKESDRLQAVLNTLRAAGIESETDGKKLVIYGGKPHGGIFDSGADHRTAMSAAILACFAEGESVINGAEAVNKSYTIFYEDLKKLGGKIDGDI